MSDESVKVPDDGFGDLTHEHASLHKAAAENEDAAENGPIVTVRVHPRYVLKNSQTRRHWAAIHELVVGAIRAYHEPEQSIQQDDVQEGEEGQVQHPISPDVADESVDDDDVNEIVGSNGDYIEIEYAKEYMYDRSGVLDKLLQELQDDKHVADYVVDASKFILGTTEKVESATGGLRTSAVKRKLNGCFNCGSIDHMVSNCPLPLDKRRIAEARQDLDRSNSRYHELSNDSKKSFHEKYPEAKPGALSSSLRRSLGLSDSDPFPFQGIIKKLGPPPFHVEELNKTTSIDEEPLLSIVNEEGKEDDLPKHSKQGTEKSKSPGPDEAHDELPYPKCKSQGSLIWRKRLLPVCTCGTDDNQQCPRFASPSPLSLLSAPAPRARSPPPNGYGNERTKRRRSPSPESRQWGSEKRARYDDYSARWEKPTPSNSQWDNSHHSSRDRTPPPIYDYSQFPRETAPPSLVQTSPPYNGQFQPAPSTAYYSHSPPHTNQPNNAAWNYPSGMPQYAYPPHAQYTPPPPLATPPVRQQHHLVYHQVPARPDDRHNGSGHPQPSQPNPPQDPRRSVVYYGSF